MITMDRPVGGVYIIVVPDDGGERRIHGTCLEVYLLGTLWRGNIGH